MIEFFGDRVLDQIRYLLFNIGQPMIHHAARLGQLKILGCVLVVRVRVVVLLEGGGIARPTLGTVQVTVHVSLELAGSTAVGVRVLR